MTHFVFAGNLSLAICVALAGLGFAGFQYARELRSLGSGTTGTPARWLLSLPLLRCAAILMVAFTLAEPTLETWSSQSQAGRLAFLLDASQSMSLTDATTHADTGASPTPDMANRNTRYARAAKALGGERGLLNELADETALTVSRINPSATDVLWQSTLLSMRQSEPLDALAESWKPNRNAAGYPWQPAAWTTASPLGERIQQAALPLAGSSAGDNPTSGAVVILSDGWSNSGITLADVAAELKQSGQRVFAIGYGSRQPLNDIGIVRIDAPATVFATNMLKGKVIISETLPADSVFRVRVQSGAMTLWETETRASGNGYREIDFSFAAEDILKAQPPAQAADVVRSGLVTSLHVAVETPEAEASHANNHAELNLTVDSQVSKILLVDERSRWETRYLRNLFSRDPAWHIDACILDSASLSTSAAEKFPSRRDELMQYDLVVLGDVDGKKLTPEQLTWIEAFVQRGGGLIIVDGPHRNLQSAAFAPLADLWPIAWQDALLKDRDASAIDLLEKQAHLETAALALPAFSLHADALLASGHLPSTPSAAATTAEPSRPPQGSEADQQLWASLPKLKFVARTRPLAGSEVLVSASSPVEDLPLIVSRRYGGGRVLYLASDETWRWRYQVGDLVHGRLWNQLARWIQKQPARMRNDFLALDTTPAHSIQGETIEVRCSLRTSDGNPATERAVIAVIRSRDGTINRRVPMQEDSQVAGDYSVPIRALPAGQYLAKVQADGFPEQALELENPFFVRDPPSPELESLACNEAALKHLAETTDGAYLHESDIRQLPNLLGAYRSGKMRLTVTPIWQTYGWFSLIIGLLIGEWLLRKRFGLI